MKFTIVFLAAAVSLGTLWRDTNSHAASERARRAYEKKDFAQAAEGYGRAQDLAPSTAGAFNLGTAQIAAGNREEGSATLAKALEDPKLTADAYFNRGNSALASRALDHAINDYVQALKANPKHEAAKRNLEIALARRESQRRAESQQQQQQKQQQQQQQQKPQPNQGQQKPQPGQMDLEALLRSVQQQEQEELRRMKAKAGEARIGW
jgi:Ca-activated chloride channel family protein